MAHSYLVRYGLMGQVGRFVAESDGLARGQTVVIRSHRGTELGEVLVPLPPSADPGEALPLLRLATAEDQERARAAVSSRDHRFEVCRRLFEDGVWPLELIDVEPLLDDGRTVLHYLGPHRLDTAGLLAAIRAACDLDVMFEAVGRDVPEELEEEPLEPAGCGSCGGDDGGCGPSGGCGSGGESAHGGCSDCGVKALLAGSRRRLSVP